MEEGTDELIRKYAIKNAVDYGKASEGPVMSKIMQALAKTKPDVKAIGALVKKTVSEVNAMDAEAIAAEYSKYADEFSQAQARKAERSSKHNFSIEGASSGSFVTRFPPEPGGYMHIGHAKPLFVENELRELYNGKMFLYFDDTNPDNERQEFVDAFKKDFEWLGIRFDKEYYASDSIQLLYGHAQSAIKYGNAYVCTCSSEEISAARMASKGCGHREQSADKNLELWNGMLAGGFADNAAILRLKGDMAASNTTMRDPTLFRIKRSRHYRQGDRFTVWPTYDFCTPILDSINGITDVIRSKEYELRDELYFAVLDILGLRRPRITSLSRLEISGNLTSKRKIRKLIADGKVSGWDDPRLVTISALRRRGVQPQAIRAFSLSFGMGKSESVVGLDMLLSYNSKLVEPLAQRLFMIGEMVGMRVSGAPDAVSLPSGKGQPLRNYALNGKVFIPKESAAALKAGDIIRLRDAFSVKVSAVGDQLAAQKTDSKAPLTVNWLPDGNYTACRVGMISNPVSGEVFNDQSLRIMEGHIESCASSLSHGDIVYFEREGLFRLDDKTSMYFISL